MSLTINHKGLNDTIQDGGRYGFQHIGINPNGYLDYISASLANIIVGNPIDHPCFEVFFPAATIQFNATYKICITGASFVPLINEHSVPMFEVIEVYQGDILSFLEPQKGTVSYIAIHAKMNTESWLQSFSESTKTLQNNQTISFSPIENSKYSIHHDQIQKLKEYVFETHPIHFIPGPAWKDLDTHSLASLLQAPFTISLQANRMGYPLKGPNLKNNRTQAYLSSGVTRGTIQLLPSGELIILMADHQTIGGYANLGQIILVDLPRLSQWNKQIPLHFKLSNVESAHTKYREIQQLLIH